MAMKQGKPLRYDGSPSEVVARLRTIDNELHNERVDWFAAQEAKLNVPVKLDFPIPAIRGWGFDYDTGLLTSLAFTDYKWDSPVEREHTNVTRRGYTGFWAVKPSGAHIVAHYRPILVGIVELSGCVIEHEFGWRAEVCTIVQLFTPYPFVLDVHRRFIEQTYQCDLAYGYLDDAIRSLKG